MDDPCISGVHKYLVGVQVELFAFISGFSEGGLRPGDVCKHTSGMLIG